ncbi:putative membrane protein [Treponema primitia ZAS-2]|uniref:Putative membrane protein n=1 Tax=Treponema primitia (strain ATCC BAA-887 / DSM 12427 / ZAS-2) TaxID=545694 RepID=F5YPG1_TREPZ|nr:DUF5668 domain-containing protein [Treponema primitia]AEF83939.1 putative membrane protein [Treponema primitia ZAS-2]
MALQTSYKITARIVFFFGLLLMFIGSAFLLGTRGGTTPFSVLRAFFFVIIGVLFAFFAIKLNKRSLYLFFATFFLLVGLFLFLSALQIIPFSFSQSWPLLSVFSGLALLPAGWHHFGAVRIRYVVPAIAFVFLGCMLMIFSFRVVPFSFKQFVVDWWFLFVVLAGLLLVLLSLGTKKKSESSSNGGASDRIPPSEPVAETPGGRSFPEDSKP